MGCFNILPWYNKAIFQQAAVPQQGQQYHNKGNNTGNPSNMSNIGQSNNTSNRGQASTLTTTVRVMMMTYISNINRDMQ